MILTVTLSGPAGAGKTQLGNAIASLCRTNGIPVTLHDDGQVCVPDITGRIAESFPPMTSVSVKVQK
jgi:hypothetical protein